MTEFAQIGKVSPRWFDGARAIFTDHGHWRIFSVDAGGTRQFLPTQK